MTNRFNERFAKAQPAIDRVFGVAVVYVRGSERFDVTIRLRTEKGEEVNSQDVIVETRKLIATISRNATPFKGSVTEPQRGDQIHFTVNSQCAVYEILNEQNSQDVDLFSDFDIPLVRREQS